MTDKQKEFVLKLYKRLFSLPKLNLNEGTLDCYRLLGIIKCNLMLIDRINEVIFHESGMMLKPWVTELWNLKQQYLKQQALAEEMIKGLLQEGIYDGYYKQSNKGGSIV